MVGLIRVLVLLVLLDVTWAATTFEVPVEHALQGGKFKTAGHLKGKISTKGGMLGNPVFVRGKLSQKDENDLKKLIQENGYYKLRIPSIPSDTSSPWVMASLRVRCLQASGFKETLRLELTEANKIVGMDYRTIEGNCDHSAKTQTPTESTFFSGEVEVLFSYPLSAPFISMDDWLINNVVDEDDQGPMKPGQPGNQKGKKEKTWLQQNWMFVLAGALIILQVMGTLVDENPGQGGQGGEAARGAMTRGGMARGGRGQRGQR